MRWRGGAGVEMGTVGVMNFQTCKICGHSYIGTQCQHPLGIHTEEIIADTDAKLARKSAQKHSVSLLQPYVNRAPSHYGNCEVCGFVIYKDESVHYRRDGYKCVTCGSTERLEADHILAESRGGDTTFENLQTLCKSCNCRKGSR